MVMMVIIMMVVVIMVMVVIMAMVFVIMTMIVVIVFAGKCSYWKQCGSNYRANQRKLAKHLGFSLLPTDANSRAGTISQDQSRVCLAASWHTLPTTASRSATISSGCRSLSGADSVEAATGPFAGPIP